MVDGWQTTTAMTVDDALDKYVKLGVQTYLITSIAQDGMLTGPDLQTLNAATMVPNVKVIAAGGIGTIGDLSALKKLDVRVLLLVKPYMRGGSH